MKLALIRENKIVEIREVFQESDILDNRDFQNIMDISGMDPMPTLGWILEGTELKSPEGISTSEYQSKRISKLALLNRFTNSELAAYYTAVEANVNLKILDKKMFAAEFIDLGRADTIAGIQALASVGIISSERASAILNTSPSNDERYRG